MTRRAWPILSFVSWSLLACGGAGTSDVLTAEDAGAGGDASTTGAKSDSGAGPGSTKDGGREASAADDAGVETPDAGDENGDAGPEGDASTAGGSSLTGPLGSLGAAKPTVAALAITNGPEVIVYLSSTPLTCDDLGSSRWLRGLPSDAQVVEIVVPTGKTSGAVSVGAGGAEVNYAAGGKSSSYEKGAASGTVTFTSCAASAPCRGKVSATYASPAGKVDGTFDATFCPGGQEY